MPVSDRWIVVVFKCAASEIQVLVKLYRFVDELKGVQSLHFLTKDRVQNQVVVSFRVMIDPKLKATIKSKIAYKLGTMLAADKFAVDPSMENELGEYVAWCPEKRIQNFGQTNFNQFIDVLKNMSASIITLIENNYFTSSELTELAHDFCGMLGCTEYGLLSASGMEIGYYDRLEDKYCSYIREAFEKTNKK
jgi:hypothetical protein